MNISTILILLASRINLTAATGKDAAKMNTSLHTINGNSVKVSSSKGKVAGTSSNGGKGNFLGAKKTSSCQDFPVMADVLFSDTLNHVILSNFVGLPLFFPVDSVIQLYDIRMNSVNSAYSKTQLTFIDDKAPIIFQGELLQKNLNIFDDDASPSVSVSGNTVLRTSLQSSGAMASGRFKFEFIYEVTLVDAVNNDYTGVPKSFNATMSLCSTDPTLLQIITTTSPTSSLSPSISSAPSIGPSISVAPTVSLAPSRPPVTFSPSIKGCISVPGWYSIISPDIDCDWFSLDVYRCLDFGHITGMENIVEDFNILGKSANEACCACGGGINS